MRLSELKYGTNQYIHKDKEKGPNKRRAVDGRHNRTPLILQNPYINPFYTREAKLFQGLPINSLSGHYQYLANTKILGTSTGGRGVIL